MEPSSKQAEQQAEQRRGKWAQCAAEWKKVKKEADRRSAKRIQASIRQLANETAASFDFDVAQAAEIADGKSRWRLPRVFGTGVLETAEETVARYWQRAATQPGVKSFVKGDAKGIAAATEMLKNNIRFRVERHAATIETEWR